MVRNSTNAMLLKDTQNACIVGKIWTNPDNWIKLYVSNP